MIPVIVRVQDGSRTGSQFVDGIFCGQFIVGGFVSIWKQMPQVYKDPSACIGFNLRDTTAYLVGAMKGDFHELSFQYKMM